MGYIKGTERKEEILFPESLDDYIEEESEVRVIDAFVDTVDMEELRFERSIPAKEGRPGYDPRDMLKLYIYGYLNRIRSSRMLKKEARRNVEVMWLIKKLKPDHRTISDFRKENKEALRKVFSKFNKVCNELGLYTKEYESIDGSKFKAVNAKDKNYTLSKLDDRIKRLESQIEEYIELLDKTDEEEKKEKDFSKEELEEKVRNIKERKERYEGYRKELETTGEKQKSLTDPESKLMKMQEGFGVCYNVQTAVDAGSHLISNFLVTDKGTDHGLIEEVAEGAKKELGLERLETVADKGYRDIEDMMKCLESGIIPNVIPAKKTEGYELETVYEERTIDERIRRSEKVADIKSSLRAGVIPSVYEGIITEIEVVEEVKFEKEAPVLEKKTEEEMKKRAEDGYFVRDIERNKVYCPQLKILREKSVKKDGSIRYYNKLACKGCRNKCTKSKYKEIDFGANKVEIKSYGESKGIRRGRKVELQKVKLKFKPDLKKLANRKCLSEHPFGTVKRALDGGYLLLKGKEKVAAELALLFMAYNMKRAINMVGVRELLSALA